jgi:hypothetical protein
MESAGVKDTTAYKIVRQIADHIYGSDEKLSNSDFISIYHNFVESGGSWEGLINGDMGSVKILEDSLAAFIDERRLHKIATNVASYWSNK